MGRRSDLRCIFLFLLFLSTIKDAVYYLTSVFFF